jgi:hypothetical protein
VREGTGWSRQRVERLIGAGLQWILNLIDSGGMPILRCGVSSDGMVMDEVFLLGHRTRLGIAGGA